MKDRVYPDPVGWMGMFAPTHDRDDGKGRTMAASEPTVTVKPDDCLPETLAVAKASVALFDCQCEFEHDLSCCGELMEAWDDAVIALKRAREARFAEGSK